MNPCREWTHQFLWCTTDLEPDPTKGSHPQTFSSIITWHLHDVYFSGPFVSAIGKAWHPDHFVCDGCGVSLQNQGFIEEGGKLYCEKDFNQYFAPHCDTCKQPISGVSTCKCFFLSLWSESKMLAKGTRSTSKQMRLKKYLLVFIWFNSWATRVKGIWKILYD